MHYVYQVNTTSARHRNVLTGDAFHAIGTPIAALARMALFLALVRDTVRHELGEFETLTILENEIRAGDPEQVVATHSQHRWRCEGADQTFNKVEISGPLTVSMPEGSLPMHDFGPYGNYLYMDGVAYADGRVFAFWDISAGDWYLTDVGLHCKALTIRFVRPAKLSDAETRNTGARRAR